MREQQQMATAVAAHHQHHHHSQPNQSRSEQTGISLPLVNQHFDIASAVWDVLRPKSTISFDLVPIRLQGKLRKSRETANELHGLTNALGDIGQTLGGAVPPPTLPPLTTSSKTPSCRPRRCSSLHFHVHPA